MEHDSKAEINMAEDAYNIAICDDNQVDAEYLASLVREWSCGRVVHVEIFPSAESFMFRYADEKDFDMLLLDIEMGGMPRRTPAFHPSCGWLI